MSLIASAIALARRIATVSPAHVSVTVDELALAMHAESNGGRTARFGVARCDHRARAARVIEYLEDAGTSVQVKAEAEQEGDNRD